MVNKMTVQAYLQIENNIVTNVVMWDGDTSQWQPPTDATMLIQANISALIWEEVIVDKKIEYALTEVLGAGEIGFTWNGSVLTTNQPQPKNP